MHIGLAFDERYLPHSRVVLQSIIDHHRGENLTFWLCSPTVDVENRRWWDRVTERYRVQWLPAPVHSGLPRSSVSPYLSEAMYYRLWLAHLLPADVDHVLYVDSDILCNGTLLPLRDLDLNGVVLAAVRDAECRRLVDEGGVPGLIDHPAVDHQGDYFNSGVLVIDTATWRERKVTARVLRYLETYGDIARYPDQDALNLVLHDDWLRISRRWNYMLHWRLEPQHGGDPSEATLVHSIGSRKFWSSNWGERYLENGVFRQRYWKYRDQVDRGLLPWEPDPND